MYEEGASQSSGSGVEDFSNEEYFEFLDQFLEHHPTDSTGYVTKIQSLLVAGRYKEAFLFLEHSCALHPEMKELLTNTYRKSGAEYFDISGEIVGAATGRSRVVRPDGDFIGAVEIRMTNNGCGKGLFATENIQRGEVLLISKALAVCPETHINRYSLLHIMRDALRDCEENARRIFLAHFMTNRSKFIPKMCDFVTKSGAGNQSDWSMPWEFYDGLNEKEKWSQILAILDLIAFDNLCPFAMREKSKEPAIFEYVSDRMYYGVWLLPSFVNHSCVPNAARINVGRDFMRIHATRTIKSGEEITIPYFNVLVPFPSRLASISKFGFTCVCKRCELEAKKMEKTSAVKDLYSEYTKINMSDEVGKRASQLQKLLTRVEKCVKNLHNKKTLKEEDLLFERWYRASFANVYLASLLNRHRNEVPIEFCLVNDTNFTDIANALIETCPGSLHCLVFFHEFRGKFIEILTLHGNRISSDRTDLYEDYVNNAWNRMIEIAPSIYGSPNLQSIIHIIFQQLF